MNKSIALVFATFLCGAAALRLDQLRQPAKPAEKKNAIAFVCFVSGNGQAGRHHAGCGVNAISFLTASPNDDVIVVTTKDDAIPEDLKSLAAADKRVKIEAVGEGPYLTPAGKEVALHDSHGAFTGNGLRQVWMANVLKKYKDAYEFVGVVDGADIVFQTNPFELMREKPTSELFFFGDRGDDHMEGAAYFEKRAKSLGLADKKLLAYVKKAFYNDKEGYSLYANGGAVFGTLQAMIDIQERMIELTEKSNFWHSDQGQMNFARYYYGEKNGHDKVTCFGDYDRSITMGHAAKWSSQTKNGQLANKDGRPFIFVHQYDKGKNKGTMKQIIEKIMKH